MSLPCRTRRRARSLRHYTMVKARPWSTKIALGAPCGVGAELGTVEVGKLADLIVVGANPLGPNVSRRTGNTCETRRDDLVPANARGKMPFPWTTEHRTLAEVAETEVLRNYALRHAKLRPEFWRRIATLTAKEREANGEPLTGQPGAA
jgi:hypothetical protein